MDNAGSSSPSGPVSGDSPSPIERVRRARVELDAAHLRFDTAVSEARAAGASLREVASASGLSHTGVSKVCDRLDRTAAALGLIRLGGRWRRDPNAGPVPDPRALEVDAQPVGDVPVVPPTFG